MIAAAVHAGCRLKSAARIAGMWLLGLAMALPSLAQPTPSPSGPQPYEVSVWFRVLFGTDGRPVDVAMVDEAAYPAAFVENVKARVARAKVPPPVRDGQPVTLRSGVELRFVITPEAGRGSARLSGVSIGPLPIRRYIAKYPEDIEAQGGWQGAATGICTVGINGRCTRIEVAALPGMPESVRKHVRASLERWEFEPQQAGGTPIEGEYVLSVAYDTIDAMPEDFRQDKFQRLLRNR